MKKLISIVLLTMILCSLFTAPALAENAQGQDVASSEMATMSVTGGTINPDGTVSWALGENILTITMPDGSVYTAKVIYDPEIPSPAFLSQLTISGTEIPMSGYAAAVATPNATDTITIVTDPADAVVTINSTVAENGEAAFNWAEGINELTIEVSKEGFATTDYTLSVEYTPADEEITEPKEATVSEETAKPEEEETVEPEGNVSTEASTIPEVETSALAALNVDSKEIDLGKFVKVASDEKQSRFSFNAAMDAAYDLTTSTSTVIVTAAEGWAVSSVKLNGSDQIAAAAGTYSLKWAKANDLEITLKQNGSDVKVVYSLILNNSLPETTADALTVNGVDVSYLTSIQAAADNSYILQVTASDGKAVSVIVNGIPVVLGADGKLIVPAVTGPADTVGVTVSKAGCLDKTYVITVTAAPVIETITEAVTDAAVSAEEGTSGSSLTTGIL